MEEKPKFDKKKIETIIKKNLRRSLDMMKIKDKRMSEKEKRKTEKKIFEKEQKEIKELEKSIKKQSEYPEKEEEIIIRDVKENNIPTEEDKKKNPRKRKRPDNALVTYTKEEFNRKSTFEKSLILLEKRRKIMEERKPEWHAPWKLYRIISGHQGWVRAIAVDVSNDWFATGSADRTIKIWDLASCKLKLTLTGHANTIRGLSIHNRLSYMFSVGEDKLVKCWDLTSNKSIKDFHGHLSGVYCVDYHPSLNLIVTGGRDCTARVWDIRTKAAVFVLTGHDDVVSTLKCQGSDPQIITGSMDKTLRLWDLRKGNTMAVLTNHKKAVRSLLIHPHESTFASSSVGVIKKWGLPQGKFLNNFSLGRDSIINTISMNHDNVLFSGCDDGTMQFFDWRTGYLFQKTRTRPQQGSLSAEAGILTSTFDRSGSRLITGQVDKTIRIFKEDEKATPETHPVGKFVVDRSRF